MAYAANSRWRNARPAVRPNAIGRLRISHSTRTYNSGSMLEPWASTSLAEASGGGRTKQIDAANASSGARFIFLINSHNRMAAITRLMATSGNFNAATEGPVSLNTG